MPNYMNMHTVILKRIDVPATGRRKSDNQKEAQDHLPSEELVVPKFR